MSTLQTASVTDAQLVLQLYDLRREAEMRKARNFFLSFFPQTADDVLKFFYAFGSQENAWLRQVISYWDMVASLVLRGALHEGLCYDTCGEMWVVLVKLKPFAKELREKLQAPEFLTKIEQVAEATPEGRARLQSMKQRFAEIAKMRAAAAKSSAAD